MDWPEDHLRCACPGRDVGQGARLSSDVIDGPGRRTLDAMRKKFFERVLWSYRRID